MKNFISACLLMFCLPPLFAQQFTAEQMEIKSEQLDHLYKHYEIYSMQTSEVLDFMQRRPDGTALTFVFGKQIFEWNVFEHQMLSPDCRIRTMQDGIYHDLSVDRRCRTFIGYREDRADEARFTISPHCFAALIPDGKTSVVIQPMKQVVPGASENLIVLYRASDRIVRETGHCDVVASRPVLNTPEDVQEIRPRKDAPQKRTFSCIELQVAFATDHRMFNTYGSVEAILDFNLTVLNFVEPFYDDFDIDFRVDDFFIVNTGSINGTPWSTSMNIEPLKDTFEDWADDHFDTHDIGHLWTSGDIYKDDFDYSLLGRADIGGVCGDIGITPWAVLENHALTDIYNLALLQAHEYGHLLDADHEPGTGTIMEPDFGAIESPTWAQANIEEMFDFIEDEDCISTCRYCPVSFNIIDYIGWGDWRYSALDHIRSTGVIDSLADVQFRAVGYVRLLPGFHASSLQPASGGATFRAYIGNCPY
jgi:hypothetical protein